MELVMYQKAIFLIVIIATSTFCPSYTSYIAVPINWTMSVFFSFYLFFQMSNYTNIAIHSQFSQ